jgi:hypothetical protein
MIPRVLIFSLDLSLKKIRSIIPLGIYFLQLGEFFRSLIAKYLTRCIQNNDYNNNIMWIT